MEIPHEDHEWADALEGALRLPVPPSGFWHRAGLSSRGERRLEITFGVVLYLLAVGWVWSLSHIQTSLATSERGSGNAAVRAAATIAAALTTPDAPTTAYLTDAALKA